MDFMGKECLFVDENVFPEEAQHGYFLGFTHSDNEDQDYAMVCGDNGYIKCVNFRKIRFIL